MKTYNDDTNPDISNAKRGGYGKYSEQIGKLNTAVSLDEEAGYKSASYGGFQIMGANFKAAGFDTVKDFATTMMSKDEDKHLTAFVNFIISNDKLLKALQDGDWATFAKIYNGPNYKDNDYDTKLKTAYDEYLDEEQNLIDTNDNYENRDDGDDDRGDQGKKGKDEEDVEVSRSPRFF